MIGLLWNILLALAWAALTGDFSPLNLIAGFVLGFIVLLLLRSVLRLHAYTVKVPRVMALIAVFVWEVVVANVSVAYRVISPRHGMRSGVIAVPLDVKTDVEITILANMISLTPGTLSLQVSEDKRLLYVHALHIDDIDKMKQRIKDGFERRIIEVTR